MRKAQETLDQIDSVKQSKEIDVNRKQDALFSTNAELSKCRELLEELRTKEAKLE